MKMRTLLKFFASIAIICLSSSCGDPLEKGISSYEIGDYAAAVEYFRKAAEQGNAEAMAYLGCCYFQGTGVEENEEQAFYWNLKGAGMDNRRAMENLEYMAGHGSKKAKEYKTFIDRVNSRLYTGTVKLYNPDDASTYSLPQGRYLATVDEYIEFLRRVARINTGFQFTSRAEYCWITSNERNKYWNIFKLANPYSPGMAVDLGLRVKWAPKNVGAKSRTDLGDKFAWGETSPKADYTWLTYKHAWGSSESIIDIGSNISYTGYDAASVNWGAWWRMPTVADYQELIDRCNLKWVEDNGVGGLRVTGPNGNSIFLPAEAISADLGLLFNTHYYTGNLRTESGFFVDAGEDGRTFKFSPDGFEFGSQARCIGCYIRPVFAE